MLKRYPYDTEQLYSIFRYAIIDSFKVDSTLAIKSLDQNMFSIEQIEEIKLLHGKAFSHKIDFDDAVYYNNQQWVLNGDRLRDKTINEKKIIIEDFFRITKNNQAKSNIY